MMFWSCVTNGEVTVLRYVGVVAIRWRVLETFFGDVLGRCVGDVVMC